MSPDSTSPGTRGARRIYGLLLTLYPVAFRRRYGEEMTRVFEDEWQRASAEGPVARWRYTLHLASDILQTAPHEWMTAVSRAEILLVAAVALAIGYISLEPLPSLLKVLAGAWLTCGFAIAVVAGSGRSRLAQLKRAALGMVIGCVIGCLLAPILRLSPQPPPQPEAPPPESRLMPVTAPAMTGEAIYARVREVYRNAKTYVDQGEVWTAYRGLFSNTEIKTFGTAFVRGGGFRFGYQDHFFDRLPSASSHEYVIWQDGPLIKRWWTIKPQVEVKGNLAEALGTAAGVSSLSSTEIPGLLLPEVSVGRLSGAVAKVALLGSQRVDGIEAYRLLLTMKHGPTFTIWVDAGSYLVVRIFFSNALPGATRADETIIYHPRLDAPVDPAVLLFTPRPVPAQTATSGWLNGRTCAMIMAMAGSFAAGLINFIHRRILRKRWRGAEPWLTPVMKRLYLGYAGIIAICLGLWLGGTDMDAVMQNCLLAQFSLHGGLMLYAIHRRSRGYARFAAA